MFSVHLEAEMRFFFRYEKYLFITLACLSLTGNTFDKRDSF